MSALDRLIFGDSEMAVRIRQTQWSSKDLGEPGSWSPTLRNAIAVCLASSAPMQVWWGRSLTLLYNDAAIPDVTSHPTALGRTVPEVWGERWSTFRSAVESVFDSGTPIECGTLRLVPMLDGDGTVAGVVATPARDSSRAELRHLANLAAVLRSPLTMILGVLDELLARGEDPVSAARESLETAHRAAIRIHKQLGVVLAFFRLESEQNIATFAPVPLAKLTQQIVEAWRAPIEQAGLALEVDVDELDEPVYVDPVLWATIVDDLLSNALKFTITGHIRVTLEATTDSPRLVVADTGVGIAREHLPNVFARFYRAPDPRARAGDGAGLGLAVVKELVRIHGGTIDVASEIDRGTRFTVSLKRGHDHLAPMQVEHEVSDRAARRSAPVVPDVSHGQASRPACKSEGGRPRILVVDDSAEFRAYVCDMLSDEWDMEEAADGLDALTSATTRPPDLLMTDVIMPGLDGIALVRALRGHPRTSQLPIILATAWSSDDTRASGLDAGADDYLVKPFTVRELRARIRTRLEIAAVRQDSTREANRAKDDFLAMVGHELRNPLSTMSTTLQALQMKDSTPEIDLLSRAQRQLTRLVEDLLESSRLSRGIIKVHTKVVELSQVVDRAMELVSPWFDDRNNRVTVTVPRVGFRVAADAERLARAFSNVLMNASQHSAGGTRISVEATRVGERLAVKIVDNGSGMTPEKLAGVFTAFQDERRTGGLGLGLAIARSLVELHGGSIAIHSQTGTGTECVIELPASTGTVDEVPVVKSGVRRRLLLVEDNDDAARAFKAALEQLGYEVALAHDAPIALNLAKTFRPDVALLDLGLPVMDGWELARRLHGESNELPIVAVTARDQDADKQRSRDLGFAEHLVKPIDLVQLEQIVERLAAAAASGDAQ
jgi:signal transduction histidine kinase